MDNVGPDGTLFGISLHVVDLYLCKVAWYVHFELLLMYFEFFLREVKYTLNTCLHQALD